MANGPYRSAYERPPSCAIHPEAPAEARCGRCGAGVCAGCAMPSGRRLVCPACTDIFGRRGVAGRALAAAILIAFAVIPVLVSLPRQRQSRAGADYLIDVAIRNCDTSGADILISSLVMHGRDGEAVAAADAFAAKCAPSEGMRAMIARARARHAER